MATSKGMIQGYTGVATVDAAHQIVVDAQAHGVGTERALLFAAVAATRDHIGAHFQGAKRDGGPCALRAQGLRTPDTTPVRNVACFQGRVSTQRVHHRALMRERIDPPEGRARMRSAPRRSNRCWQICAPTSGSVVSRCVARKGRYAMEFVLPGAPHRETGARGIRGVGRLQAPSIAIDVDHRYHTRKIASVNCEIAYVRGTSAQTAFEIDLSYGLNARFCSGRIQSSAYTPRANHTAPVGSKQRSAAATRSVGHTEWRRHSSSSVSDTASKPATPRTPRPSG